MRDDSIRAAGVPDSLVVLVQSPYLLGPPMLAVAAEIDGEHVVDAGFRDPPRSESAFLTPTTLADREGRGEGGPTGVAGR